jgi:transcriptional regulator with XRE-family HTH domain
MSIEKAALGAAVKQVRQIRGLTQIELAKAAGLSKGGKSIALVEQGKRFVSVDTLNAVAKALDIPPACLAVLGSRSIGRDKVATEFMQNLQGLIANVLLAQARLGASENIADSTTRPGNSRPRKKRRSPGKIAS